MLIQEPSGKPQYGVGDVSFQAAGAESGIRRLVDDFYAVMDMLPEAAVIRAMHPQDLQLSRDKLARFLCGWLGGPKLYAEKYGAIHIPAAHRHLAIGSSERDQWLLCMQHAIAGQDYSEEFKAYLLAQLRIPAERCRTQD